MPLPVIAGVVRASFRGLMPSGRQWVNVLHCQYAGGASSPGTVEINALDTNLARIYTGAAFGTGAAWLTQCPAATTLIDATYYVLNGTAPPLVINHAAIGSGAGSGLIPSEVAIVATIRTLTRGRRYRGRIYLPAPSSLGMTASGNLSTTVAANTDAQIEGCMTSISGIQWKLGVASYGTSWLKDKNNPHGAQTLTTWSPFFTEANNITVDVKPDVQRRRK